jgi:glycosyltransferase involved in cell wall biosynthesis
LLIDAFEKIKSSNVILKIFGSGLDPLYINKLFEEAKDDKRIESCGGYPEKNVGDISSHVDVVIIPSLRYENYPVVLHEALVCNTPVIASNAGGMSEKIKDGVNVNGFTCPMGMQNVLGPRSKGSLTIPRY